MRWRAGGTDHAEHLPRMIEAVLAEAGGGFEALDALAVSIGPGSFTGIRTGLAAARGLALVTGLRVFAVTTPEALAVPLAPDRPGASPIVAGRAARRGRSSSSTSRAGRAPERARRPLSAAAAPASAGRHGPRRNGAPLVLAHLDAGRITVAPGRLDAAAVATAASALGRAPVRASTCTRSMRAAPTPGGCRPLPPRVPGLAVAVLQERAPADDQASGAPSTSPAGAVHKHCFTRKAGAAPISPISWAARRLRPHRPAERRRLRRLRHDARGRLGLLRVVRATCELLSLGVVPAHRPAASPVAILRRAMQSCYERCARTMFLVVAIDNLSAQALYERSSSAGRHPPDYYARPDGSRMHAYTMRADLVTALASVAHPALDWGLKEGCGGKYFPHAPSVLLRRCM
jgi:tRNA threonylcarbamoyladenosine biosynthesis protein TsaB